MYSAKHKVYLHGKLVDEYITPFGIRSIRFSPEDGFQLNGQRVFLKGGNIHHDAGCLGAAADSWTLYKRLSSLKEMGCNAIRLAHNPHSPELLNICDTMGILVINELIDKWEVNTYTTPDGKWTVPLPSFDFKTNWEDYLRRFVDRDKNHPSVILWSVGNEVVEADQLLGAEIMGRMRDYLHKYEPSRPVTAAIQPPGHTNGKPWPMAFNMDVVSYNYLSQYYKDDKEKYNFIILGSETLPYYTRDVKSEKENQELYTPVNSFFEAEKYAIGHIIWSGIDYLGEAVQPWPLKGWENAPINTAGFKKPFFYYLKSIFTTAPMVYIAVRDKNHAGQVGKYGWDWPVVKSHWNWEQQLSPLDIVVYSNCQAVELFLNGKTLGTNSIKNANQGYFEFKVPYQQGC
ncbi:MAG: glycoside hydrolase family 2 protein, partial [Bacteroidales bacterium]|nr:glycoside hydrolase family 2 protein [Bacteroidales bacterium]